MALRVIKNPTFTIPVTVPIPGAPGEVIHVTYKYKDGDDLAAWIREYDPKGAITALMEVVISVDGFEDESGAQQTFSEQTLRDKSRIFGVLPKAMVRAYIDELLGANGPREKN